jgi:hypothetical protein
MALLLTLGPVSGCASRSSESRIEPAPGAATVSTGGAVEEIGGVRMVVGEDVWPGKVKISGSVTPLDVTVENHGQRPLLIRYGKFTLIGPEGQRFPAIPPFQVKGSVKEPAVAESYAPITAPEFTYRAFMIAPYLSKLYPGIDAYTEPFSWPYDDDSTYERYWTQVDLPTATMLQRALPEGVLNPGGLLGGWLYFRKVDADIFDISFRADLVDAKTGEKFGTVQIPFQAR